MMPIRRCLLLVLAVLALIVAIEQPTVAARFEIAEREAINPGLHLPPPDVLRSTPKASWRGFMEHAANGDYSIAAHYLDLSEVPEEDQSTVGGETAERLYLVLVEVDADPKAVAVDSEEGPTVGDEPINVIVAKRFRRDQISGEVWLRRTRDAATGEHAWLFTRQTVSNVALWLDVLVSGEGNTVLAEALNSGLEGVVPAEIDRSSPRSTVVGYLLACRRGDFVSASHYLDLDGVAEKEQAARGARLARRLKIILDATYWVNPEALSNDPGGIPEAGLPADTERLTELEAEGHLVDVLLKRYVGADGSAVWVFHSATVDEIDVLYDVYGVGWFGDHLPTFFFTFELGQVQLWQWLAIVLLILVGRPLSRIAADRLEGWARAVSGKTSTAWDDAILEVMRGPLRLALLVSIFFLAIPWLHLSEPATRTVGLLWRPVLVLCLAWLASRVVEMLSRLLSNEVGDASQVFKNFVPIFARIAKIGVWIIGVVVVLDQVGVEVMGLVAGLGIGGLAIAFAAQKTIENVFGSLAIAADRPFEIGDFVQIGGLSGTVEDVGLRSTKIRTAARTRVTIPNSAVMGDRVETFAARDRFLVKMSIGLLYSTSKSQLEFVIDEIKRYLGGHANVFQDLIRVRFQRFGDSALEVSVYTYILADSYNSYTAVAEEINFEIMAIVERAGTDFAFPSRTLYTVDGSDNEIDPEHEQRVREIVEERRERGDLWIPERPEG